MNYSKNIYAILSLSILATGSMAASNAYRQELKDCKKTPIYKTILDRRSNGSLRKILAKIEIAKEHGVFHRLLRAKLLMVPNTVVITAESMPKLYGYVNDVCKQQNMRTPTILITRDKSFQVVDPGKFIQSDSTKQFTSSGAILISQDLLLETSEKALEAAIAYEIAHIKYNHNNKTELGSYVFPPLAGLMLTMVSPRAAQYSVVTSTAAFLLPRILIAKNFEKQADRFVYDTMNNAEGLIELCTYLQEKDGRNEADYADTRASLKTANIAFFAHLRYAMNYRLVNFGHKLNNAYKWLSHNTILTQYQSNKARIKAAQQYLEEQKDMTA